VARGSTGAACGQASYWLDKAKEGHPAAQYGLSVCLQKGWGTSRDLVAAARWVRSGAPRHVFRPLLPRVA
jgi:hypothetical protein